MAIKTFTTGEVLTASDTNTYLNDSGLVLITSGVTVSSTGGTAATVANGTVTIGTSNSSVTVSGVFSSTYDNYRIIISGGTGSAADNLSMQLTGITGSVYRQLGFYQEWGTGTINSYADGVGSTNWLLVSVNAGYSAITDLTNPFASKVKYANVNGLGTSAQYIFPSFCNSTSSASGFKISLASATLTGGTIRVYGYRQV